MSSSEALSVRPACYQDLLDSKPLFQKMRVADGGPELVRIIPGGGRHCPANMAGPSFLLSWRWADSAVGGSQGHLPIARYETASQYRRARQADPVLFVAEG